AYATVTGKPAAVFSVTVNVAVPAASFTVTLLIDSAGAPSLSPIVPVPVADAFVVTPAVTVAVSVKFSVASNSASSTIGVRASTDVPPAAIVADAASAHVAPPSVETCKLPAPLVPKSTPPPVAVPSASARLNVVAFTDGFEMLTVKTAKLSVPSTTVVSLTASAGVSLSVPPLPVPSSLIVPRPVPSAIV